MLLRGYTIFGLVFLALLAGLAAVNVYILSPSQDAEPAPVQAVTPDSGKVLSKNITQIMNTLQAIQQEPLPVQEKIEQEEPVTLLNPFLWPEERAELGRMLAAVDSGASIMAEKGAKEEKIVVEEKVYPVIKMIIMGDKSTLVLLDDTYVSEGDTYQDYIVKKVARDEIVLQDKTGEIHLSLAQDVPALLIEEKVVPEEAQGTPGTPTDQSKPPMFGTSAGEMDVEQQVQMMNTMLEQLKPFLQERSR